MKLILSFLKSFDDTEVNIPLVDKNLIIPIRVIFDVRINAEGSVIKYEARLVA